MDGHTEGFALLCHPDLIFLHATGLTEAHKRYLSKTETGRYTCSSVEHPIHPVSIVDGTAVVLGNVIAELSAKGETILTAEPGAGHLGADGSGFFGHAGLPLGSR